MPPKRNRTQGIPTQGPPDWNKNPQFDNALLPYLALGFTLQDTAATGFQCGVNALAISLKAVRELNEPGPINDHLTGPQIGRLLEDPRFTIHLNAMFDKQGLDPLSRRLLTAELSSPQEFDIVQLHVFLSILNEEHDWHYQLGHITQGFRSRWYRPAQKPVKWQQDFMQHTVAAINSVPDVSRGPIVWIYSDNAENINSAHELDQNPDERAMGHWCGISPAQCDIYWDIVGDWDLDDRIQADVKAKVWRVTRDCPGDKDNGLLVHRGAWVRPWDEGTDPPAGSINVETYDQQHRGHVPLDALEQVVLKENGADGYQNGDYQGIDKPASSGRADHLSSFPICRIIPSTDKLAVLDEDGTENKGLDQLKKQGVSTGGFVLDFPSEKVEPLHCRVRTINGQYCIADPRRLQLLQLSPWGITGIPQLVGPEADYENMKHNELKQALESFGVIKIPKLKADRLELLKSTAKQSKSKKGLKVGIPIYRLLRSYPKDPPQTITDFLDGEIVLVLGDMKKSSAAGVRIRDYEGNCATVKQNDLAPIVERPRFPWGISLHRDQLKQIQDKGEVECKIMVAAQKKRSLPASPNSSAGPSRKKRKS